MSVCTILNPGFSLLVLAVVAFAIILIPPAIAIFTSSFYKETDTIYGQVGAARIFFTAFMLMFLWLGDMPWQIYRLAQYYQNGQVTQATVVMQRSQFGRLVPFYQYTPSVPPTEQLILADASLVPSHSYGQRSASFNWLHKEGMVVPIRVIPSCPAIAWTQVQDVSIVFGLLPILGIIVIWLIPEKLLLKEDAAPVASTPDSYDWQKSDDRWRRP